MNARLLSRIRHWVSEIADLAFPPVCTCCGDETGWDEEDPGRTMEKVFDAEKSVDRVGSVVRGTAPDLAAQQMGKLCPRCWSMLTPRYAQQCRSCGAGLSSAGKQIGFPGETRWVKDCSHCPRQRFHFRACHTLGNYELGLRDAVLKIKSGAHDALIFDMARLLSHKITCTKNLDRIKLDGVIPIPAHWRRRLTRGTVVSELLAETLAREQGLDYLCGVLGCNRLTRKQGTLSTSDRIRNVKQAFRIRSARRLAGRNVLIVDDVMTSGATLNEATTCCLQAGAKSISVAIIARGIGRSLNR